MKKQTLMIAACAWVLCGTMACTDKQPPQEVLTDGIRFCESTYPYRDGLLVANFGTERFDPLNREGKGYILFYRQDKCDTLIYPQGYLSAPKGMYVAGDRLYVCDVNELAEFDLNQPDRAPKKYTFAEEDLFLNDLAALGKWLYVSVTNTGRIYRLDISRTDSVGMATPEHWMDIPGPNGLAIHDGAMYVACYSPDGTPTSEHAIYRIDDMEQPQAEIFYDVPGQYDGIAVSPDGSTIYVSNWAPAQVIAIEAASRQAKVLPVEGLSGPADMTLRDGVLYIPDLPASRVVVHPL